jgi:hypothetical protein
MEEYMSEDFKLLRIVVEGDRKAEDEERKRDTACIEREGECQEQRSEQREGRGASERDRYINLSLLYL